MLFARYVVVILLTLFAIQVQAADWQQGPIQEGEWFSVEHGNGLTSRLQFVPQGELLRQIRQLRRELLTRKAVLEQTVEDSSFGLKDALITALVPGGLLYAAQKTHSHEQAKKELAHVLAQFDELAMDLLRLKAASDEATVAILY